MNWIAMDVLTGRGSGRWMQVGRAVLLVSMLILAACGPAEPTATPTPSVTPTPLPTDTPVPTATPSPTATVTPTVTPSPTLTLTPSTTPTATPTGQPTVGFAGDNWTMAEVAAPLGAPLTEPWVAFVNINDRDGVGDVRTPQPATNVQTLYLVNPRTAQRVAVLQVPSTTNEHVYWSPTGERVAYFLENEGTGTGGLYVFDLTIGVSSRLLAIDSLTQRGFFSPPRWSPDGTQLVIALATAYDMDVFIMNADGTDMRSLMPEASYDFWPAWSPGGRYILFVSDRDDCPSWLPGDGCFEANPDGPLGGYLYVYDTTTGESRRLSEELITEAPYWINDTLIGFATGSLVMGDDHRYLWQVDVRGGDAMRRTLDDADFDYYLGENWSDDGQRVFFQRAGDVTDLMLMGAAGAPIASTDRFTFARFAVHADWSPDGTRLVIGGRNGQCPYGLIVTDQDFQIIANSNPPPTACDPYFSPDSSWIAYSGINPQIDGRLDLYVANSNGFGAVNQTASLRGQIRVLGWVGGTGAADAE